MHGGVMQSWLYLVIGLAVGLAVALLVSYFMRRGMLKDVKSSFAEISLDALSRQQQLGGTDLEYKKEQISQLVDQMKAGLEKVQKELGDHRAQREKQFSEMNTSIKGAVAQTASLQDSTNRLNAALSSSQVRGQWGERMAEDVLRLAGFVEGVNYLKQQTLEGAGTRPDYTFLLPQGQRVHMDVKFPLGNYLQYVSVEAEADREKFKAQFLRDARTAIKQVTGREYISTEEHTLNYVLVFIPNEQVYGFIKALTEDALRDHVILCSPMTLFAVLAVIRQALDSFRLETTASEILAFLGAFNKQWTRFGEGMDKMGRRLDDAQREYQQLLTTRTNALERPLRQIEDLRLRQGIGEEETVTPHPEELPAPLPTPEEDYDAG